jgi:nicotinate-nucleotide adenylyltransferase
MRMCELALRDLRRVELSSIEHELGGTSLTLRTLEALRAQRPGAALRLVIGSDLVAETPSWHRFERVVELAPLLIVPRAGYPIAGAAPALPEVSSTEIRRRLRAGLDTNGLLDPEVAAYAAAHDLYR